MCRATIARGFDKKVVLQTSSNHLSTTGLEIACMLPADLAKSECPSLRALYTGRGAPKQGTAGKKKTAAGLADEHTSANTPKASTGMVSEDEKRLCPKHPAVKPLPSLTQIGRGWARGPRGGIMTADSVYCSSLEPAHTKPILKRLPDALKGYSSNA